MSGLFRLISTVETIEKQLNLFEFSCNTDKAIKSPNRLSYSLIKGQAVLYEQVVKSTMEAIESSGGMERRF